MKRLPAISILVILLLTACKSRQVTAVRNLSPMSPDKLLREVVLNLYKTPHYSAKADVEFDLGKSSKGSKAYIKLVSDSALWVSVTPALGIEMARMVLSTDSVKFLNKLEDNYYLGTQEEALDRFGLDGDLDLMQSLLLGLPAGLDPDDKYRSDREDGQYVLVSREKRRFIRAAEDIAIEDSLLLDDPNLKEKQLERALRRASRKDAVIFKYWFDPDTYLTTRVLLIDIGNDQQADIRYLQRTTIDEHSFPTKAEIILSDTSRSVSAELELSRIKLQGPLKLSFRIPEKYEPLQP